MLEMSPKQTEGGKTESQKIVILTTCIDDWGGSEELWARSIPALLLIGFHFTVFKSKINRSHPEYVSLKNKGVEL